MKANGMRAWRATAKRWRRKQNRANRMTGAPWINDANGRWYRRQRACFHQRPVIQSRPFCERSLCGMTMGARKRMLERQCWTQLDKHPYKAGAPAGASQAEEVRSYRRWVANGIRVLRRDDPRLGQRLRPCPGCEECRGYDDGIGVVHCDGSGVLPARERKVRT